MHNAQFYAMPWKEFKIVKTHFIELKILFWMSTTNEKKKIDIQNTSLLEWTLDITV